MDLPPGLVDSVCSSLLPMPRELAWSSGVLALGPEHRLVLSERPSSAARTAAQRLSALVAEEHGITCPVTENGGCPPHHLYLATGEATSPEPVAAPPATEGLEAYQLAVTAQGAGVAAASDLGLLWGAMTLRQLFVRHEGAVLAPQVRISDWPRYAWRGFQIDSGRAPNSLPKIKRIIRICSAFKLNLLVYREGDDELNAVRYRHGPLGSENPHALTMNQVADMVAYAAAHGITVVPEIESLGHSQAKARHYPHLVSGGIETNYEGIGVHRRKAHLRPGDPETLALLEGIYSEWAPLLGRQGLVHLGLDEVLMPPEPQAEHLARLLRMLRDLAARLRRPITPIVWADAPPTPPEHADGVVRCLWSYAEHRDHGPVGVYNSHLIRQGIEALSRPGSQQSVIMAGGSGAGHTPYSKSPYSEAFDNLAQWAQWGSHLPNYIGLFAVQWSGNMVDHWLPDFLMAADCAWHPSDRRGRSLPVLTHDRQMARISTHLQRLRDYTSAAPEEVDPPAWDGIWLHGRHWGSEILGARHR